MPDLRARLAAGLISPQTRPLWEKRGAPKEVSVSDTVLDVKGLRCPLPVLRANRVLRGLPPGAQLRVLATDRASVADFQAFCHETGHALVAFSEEAGVFRFLIRRRATEPEENPSDETQDGPETPR